MALENITIKFFCFRHYNEGDYMAKVGSCIVCKQQAQKNDVIRNSVDNTDSINYSLNDCEKSSTSDDDDVDDGITITSAYSTSIKGL